MIAINTSALMAAVLDEPAAEACSTALAEAAAIIISAAMIADRRRAPQPRSCHGTADPWM
jgi:uncharacterized protein with PIN domain